MGRMMFTAILIAIIALGACTNAGKSAAGLKKACEDNNGNWIDSAMECEGISKAPCESLGGQFNECASACRNNPDAQVCTMQCVLVCSFRK